MSSSFTNNKFLAIIIFINVICLLMSFSLASRETKMLHKCIHDQIMEKFQPEVIEMPEDETSRILQTTPAAPIRITTDYSNLTAAYPSNTNLVNYLKQIVEQAKYFFTDMLTVIPFTGPIKLPTTEKSCLSHTIPTTDPIFSTGITNSDIHFYITITDEPNNSFLAYAGTCYFFSIATRKFPRIARINFNYHYIKDVNTTDNLEFEDQLETAIHEFTHAFGFSGGLIKGGYWYNKTSAAAYDLTKIYQENVTIRGIPTHLLFTPNVLETAKKYFNCNTMTGMQLENQGSSGSLGSHWERTLIQNEMMTAQAISTDSVFSNFTIALLKDTGFYESVRETPYDKMTWGKGRGCSFVNKACNDTTQTFPEFCTDAQVASSLVKCNYEQTGAGYCYGTNEFGDKCPFIATYSNRYCQNSSETAFKSYTKFGINSHCFMSTLLPAGYSGGASYDCLEAFCIEGGAKINITVNAINYTCTTPGQLLSAQSGQSGSITCPPDFSVFCDSAVSCLNSCSKNGYCMGQECFCNPNYAGESCTIACTTVLNNGQCVDSCPASTFRKNSTKECYPCHSSCATCKGILENQCLTCSQDLYLSENMCVSQCTSPFLKENVTYTCTSKCPITYFAFINANECVQSCPIDTFADNSTQQCQSQCSAGLFKFNAQRICVPDCKNYSLLSEPVNGVCADKCLDGQYTDSQNMKCGQNCSSGQFANVETHLCVSSCPTTLYKYQTNSSCLSSCPSNLQQDNITMICYEACSSTQFYDQTTQKCVSNCPANYFKDTKNKICTQNCSQGYFIDERSQSCVQNCTDPTYADESQGKCVSQCPELSNTVSRTCVSVCPTTLLLDNVNKKCVVQCPASYFADTPINNCTQQCSTVGMFAEPVTRNCSENCSSNYYEASTLGTCVIQCPVSLYSDAASMKCVSKCPNPRFANQLILSCVETCPDGYFADSTTNLCVQTCPQGSFAYSATKKCLDQCPDGTIISSSSNICQQNCPDGQFQNVATKTCLAKCPTGTYADAILKICADVCSSGSFGVNSTNTCDLECPISQFAMVTTHFCLDRCYPPLFADKSTKSCVNKCPAGVYSDNQLSICSSNCTSPLYADPTTFTCVDTCPGSLLSDATSRSCVDKCKSGFLADMLNRACVTTCPDGYQANWQINQCQLVNNCKDTQFFFQASCLDQCVSPYYGDSVLQTCVTNCTGGKYADPGSNRTCVQTCSSSFPYINHISLTCVQKCPQPLYSYQSKMECLQTCPTSTWTDKANYICQPCNEMCATCQGPNVANCTSCAPGVFMNQSQIAAQIVCVNQCPIGYYGNQATSKCETCDISCQKCQSLQICYECKSKYIMDQGVCQSGCGIGKLVDLQQNVCVDCQSPCSACDVVPKNCTACLTGFFMLVANSTILTQTKQCVTVCPPTHYADKVKLQCIPCNSACNTCVDATHCTTCILGLFLNLTTGTCQSPPENSTTCGTGQYYNITKKSCEYCSAKIPQCKSCTLLSGVDLRCDDCGVGGFFNLTQRLCKNCSDVATNCNTCDNVLSSTDGSSTQTSFTCLCAFGLYYDPVIKACVNCQTLIPGCIGQCFIDKANKNLLTCKDCGPGKYFDTATSPPNCKACSDSLPGCLSCNRASATSQVVCNYCGSGKYYDSNLRACALCVNSFKGCLECGADPSTTSTGSGIICLKCENNFYFNYAKVECEPCLMRSDLCQTCNSVQLAGLEKFFCLTCLDGAFMDTVAQKCTSCESKILGCALCTVVTLTGEFQCLSCKQGYAYVNTTTSKTCKFLTTNTQICNAFCDNCVLEVANAVCKRCKAGYMLKASDKSCLLIQNCLDGQYFSGETCQLCSNIDKNCIKCQITQEGQPLCTQCDNNYQLQSNTCTFSPGTINCPDGCTDCVYSMGIVKCSTCTDDFQLDSATSNCQLNCLRLGLDNCIKCQKSMIDSTKGTYLSICTVCNTSYILSPQNKCVQQTICPQDKPDYFAAYNPVAMQCEQCSSNCRGCKYDVEAQKLLCLLCKEQYVLTNLGECQYVGDSQPTQSCPPGCKDCTFDQLAGIQSCGSCFSQYTKELDTKRNVYYCKVICDLTLNKNCAICLLDTTTATPTTHCQECNQGYSLDVVGKCVETQVCLDPKFALFYNPINTKCENCTANCARCKWDSAMQFPLCLFPTINYTLTITGKCVPKTSPTQSACPDGMFADSLKQECTKCPENCAQCEIDQLFKVMICKQCQVGYTYQGPSIGCQYINSLNGTTQTSIVSCQSGLYFSLGSQQCESCPYGCATCKPLPQDNIKVFCGSCISETDWYMTLDGHCLYKICKLGYFFNPEAEGCDICPKMCAKCMREQLSGRLICAQCFPEAVMDEETKICSIKQCPSGTTMILDTCQSCPDYCSICSLNPLTQVKDCKKCRDDGNYTLLGNICTPTCPSAYFYDLTGKSGSISPSSNTVVSQQQGCKPCPSSCLTCSFDLNLKMVICATCIKGYTLVEKSICKLTTSLANITGSSVPFCETSEMVVRDPTGMTQAYTCKPCSVGCKSCIWDVDKQQEFCSECSDIYLFQLNSVSQRCIPIVGKTPNCVNLTTTDPVLSNVQFYSFMTKKCERCPEGCTQCNMNYQTPEGAAVQCTACNETKYQLKSNLCFLKCQDTKQYAVQRQQAITVVVNNSNTTVLVMQQVCEVCPTFCSNCELNMKLQPPKPVCYQCQSGNFYLKDGVCIALPQCKNNEYLILLKKGWLDQEPQCIMCPQGCNYCKAQDLLNPLSKVVCGSCDTTKNLKLDEAGNCIPNIWFEKKTCLASEYLVYNANLQDPTLDSWECRSCPSECSSCDLKSNKLICFACKTGFYFSPDQRCVQQATCESGQYLLSFIGSSDSQCEKCPDQCTECSLINRVSDIKMIRDIKCTKCISDFVLNPSLGKCLKPVNITSGGVSTTQAAQIAQACSKGQYAFIVDGGYVKCQTCIKGCTSCSLEDPTKTFSKIICQSCSTGYQLYLGQCIAQCSAGTWPNVINSTTICQPCNWKCSQCFGSDDMSCTECTKGYSFNQKGQCVEVATTQAQAQSQGQTNTTTQCGTGLDAYLNSMTNKCICFDDQKMFDLASNSCKSPNQIFVNCTIGQYYNSTQQRCNKCRVNGNRQTCSVCVGPQPTDCLECAAGDFFQEATFTCNKCSDGCEKCQTKAICDVCKDGFYLYIEESKGTFIKQCFPTCPAGTLPSIASLYYLNKDLFTESEIKEKFSSDITSASTSMLAALAIGINGQPVFDGLPWKIIEKIPTYNGKKVRLECLPCLVNCKQCISSMLLVKDKMQCIWNQFCPDDYTKKAESNQQVCIKSTSTSTTETLFVKKIQVLSLASEATVQPLNKKLIVSVYTNQDSSSYTKYEWNVTDIKQEVEENGAWISQDLSSDDFQAVRMQLLQSVAVNQQQFKAPQDNLKKNIAYQLEVKASYKTLKPVYDKIWVHVRSLSDKKTIQSLGINPSMFSVQPEKGISGNTTFRASYTLGSVQIFANSKAWKFTIEVGKDSIPLVSYKTNDFMEFIVPVNRTADTIVEVKFTISQGEDYFETARKIIATKNPSFDLAQSNLMSKIANNTGKLNQGDLATGAAMIKEQVFSKQETCSAATRLKNTKELQIVGPCTMKEDSPCCGHGVCAQGKTSSYICICQEGYAGLFCNLMEEEASQLKKLINNLFQQLDSTPITNTTAQSVISTVKQVAGSQLADKETVQKLLDKLQQASQFITDSKTLNQILDAIKEVQGTLIGNIYGKNDTTLAQQQQYNAFKSIQSAILNNAQKLTPSNPETVFNSGGVFGKNKLIEQSSNAVSGSTETLPFDLDLPDSKNVSQSSIRIGLSSSTLASKAEATAVSAFVTPKEQFSAHKNASSLISDSVDISIIKADGSVLSLQQLPGNCPVSFKLLITEAQVKNFTCRYYDTETDSYSDNGCTIASTNTLKADLIEVNCCCNHLSLFSIYQVSDTTSNTANPTNTNNNNTNNNNANNNQPQQTINNNNVGDLALQWVAKLLVLLILLVTALN